MSFGARFLRDAATFPASNGGQAWGKAVLTVNFAGGPYRFGGLTPDQRQLVEQRFAGLCGGDDGTSPVRTRVFRLADDSLRRFDTRGWEYSLDLRHDAHAVEIAGLNFMARIVLDGGTPAGYLWTDSADGFEFVSVLENFFRILTAYRLLQLGGVLLHSAGVLEGGRAHLFFGHSNAGKTTVSRLSAQTGRAILSDDLNALCRREDGSFYAEKMPFAGEFGPTETDPGAYPVRGLYRLHKALQHGLQAMPAAAAVAALVACAPYVNADPWRQAELLANLEQLVKRLPVLRLSFAPDPGFWPILNQDTEALAL